MRDFQGLLEKIKSKKTKIGVIGLGYVGLPLALLFAQKGFKVTGFVRSDIKFKSLNKGISWLGDKDIDKALSKTILDRSLRIKITAPLDLEEQDVIIICVPTPVDKKKNPDLTDLENVGKLLSGINLKNKLIINESTVAPFTTLQIFGDIGKNYFLVCSPERVDPGNKSKEVENIAKVIGGKDSESLLLGKVLYNKILNKKVISVKSLEAAEMTKMLENTYRAVNIALINEFARLCEKCNVDILDVIKAAKSKWSFHAHYPGIGVGGHCIPVDPYYVLKLAKSFGVPMRVVQEGLIENESMPHFVFKKVLENYKKGMKVLVYGITYKKNVNDLRESSVIEFCNLLEKEGINFAVYDPFIERSKIEELGFKQGELKFVDLFVIGTDHNELEKDYLKTVGVSTIIIDGRNFFKTKRGKKIIGVGRNLM